LPALFRSLSLAFVAGEDSARRDRFASSQRHPNHEADADHEEEAKAQDRATRDGLEAVKRAHSATNATSRPARATRM